MLDIRSVVCFAISCIRIFFDQLSVFRSVRCKHDFVDQLCLIFDQLSVFRSVVSRTFSISSRLFFSISCKRIFFDKLYLIFDHLFVFRSVVSGIFSSHLKLIRMSSTTDEKSNAFK